MTVWRGVPQPGDAALGKLFDRKVVYKSDACIRSRMRGLTIFLNQVMRSPYLRQDASVVGFLHVADDVEWGHVKKATDCPFLVGIKRDVDHVEKCCAQYDKATRPPVAPPKATSYFPRYATEPSVAEIQASANRHEHVATCITRALFFSEAKRIK
ncbi:hypothetical protein DYB32_001351 [Aphanomyces invadans]|uniref:PX domain-containing protein n=1 Tax=Aphanomyces invadans TaxID=157072 RepID=A0A3R7AF80_9STRA|nr:hypothetical protein DYB32_001351 [Aphanomyces invadans]